MPGRRTAKLVVVYAYRRIANSPYLRRSALLGDMTVALDLLVAVAVDARFFCRLRCATAARVFHCDEVTYVVALAVRRIVGRPARVRSTGTVYDNSNRWRRAVVLQAMGFIRGVRYRVGQLQDSLRRVDWFAAVAH